MHSRHPTGPGDRHDVAVNPTPLAPSTTISAMTPARTDHTDLAQLRLGPATRLLWRDRRAVHLELGDTAVVLTGMAPDAIAAVARRQPGETSLPLDATAAAAVARLGDAGFLWPRSAAERDPYLAAPAPRLARELVGLSARAGTRAAAVLTHRRQRSVQVGGAGGAAVQLAAVLAAAGVGRIRCEIDGTARLADVLPGAVACSDEGRSLAAATDDALARVAPDVATGPPSRRAGTSSDAARVEQADDLTVLVVDGPVDDERRTALHAAQVPHLLVEFGTDQGSVGPLVLPGLTSCLRCADLHRRDRDPAWPVLAAQLASAARRGNRCGAALTSLVTSIAAVQILAFLDGEDPAVVDGSLEVQLPDWRVRRRTRHPHPDCECVPRS